MIQIKQQGDNYEVYEEQTALTDLEGGTTQILVHTMTVSLESLQARKTQLQAEIQKVDDIIALI